MLSLQGKTRMDKVNKVGDLEMSDPDKGMDKVNKVGDLEMLDPDKGIDSWEIKGQTMHNLRAFPCKDKIFGIQGVKALSNLTILKRNNITHARSGIEQTQFDSMAEIMKTISLVPRVDRYIWSLENDGSFSVASIRKTLDDNRFQEESLSTRWVKSVPIKVNILAWKVKSNALPTRFNISRRGMDIDSIDCPICKMGVETTSHVFFQCNVVRQVMRKISSWWNVEYMEVNSYEEWRSWLVSTRIRSNIKVIIEGIYYGLWWVMWNFRNKILFDTKIPEKGAQKNRKAGGIQHSNDDAAVTQRKLKIEQLEGKTNTD
ncbi:RNA-directed DNA polymerase, eukaryota [Tanacetum coccineum]